MQAHANSPATMPSAFAKFLPWISFSPHILTTLSQPAVVARAVQRFPLPFAPELLLPWQHTVEALLELAELCETAPVSNGMQTFKKNITLQLQRTSLSIML